MLDKFLVHAAAQRLRSCVFGKYIDAFCARLERLGYSHATIHTKLWAVDCLARWMIGSYQERFRGRVTSYSVSRLTNVRRDIPRNFAARV